MKIKTALILCAGFGKRVQPITDNLPKPLISTINSLNSGGINKKVPGTILKN